MSTTTKKASSKKNTQKRPAQKDFERGNIEEVVLKKPFTLNGTLITKALIEIDHINYGINTKTYKLNTNKRSDFSTGDVEKFLYLLDGEYIPYKQVKGKKLRYEVKINSPISGRYLGKEYILVFETDYDKQNLIHTITLFPKW